MTRKRLMLTASSLGAPAGDVPPQPSLMRQALCLVRPALLVLLERISPAHWRLLQHFLLRALEDRAHTSGTWTLPGETSGDMSENDVVFVRHVDEVVRRSVEAVGAHPLMEELVERVKDTLNNQTGESSVGGCGQEDSRNKEVMLGRVTGRRRSC